MYLAVSNKRPIAKIENSLYRGGSGGFKSGKPYVNKGKNQFRNHSGSGNNQQSGDRFKAPLQAVDQPFRA